MKGFVKGKCFPHIMLIGMLLIVVFLMAVSGWRITYAPELNSDWNAISATAGWVGSIGSVLAVVLAIKVADRQNKIALFEKRYKVYNILLHCISFSESLKSGWELSKIRSLFIVSFSLRPIIEDGSETMLYKQCTKYVMDAKETLDTASFLFNFEINSYTDSIISILFDILFARNDLENQEENCRKYKAEVQKMMIELLPKIKRELSLLK